jgi:hypothetical protein
MLIEPPNQATRVSIKAGDTAANSDKSYARSHGSGFLVTASSKGDVHGQKAAVQHCNCLRARCRRTKRFSSLMASSRHTVSVD